MSFFPIDQRDRVRDGSDSKEQEHLVPFGYARTPRHLFDVIDMISDNLCRTVEGEAC
jgi:hypothetical protein